MGPLSAYSIPIQGLKIGLHEYHYVLESDFFHLFEGSLIRQGVVQAKVVVDKRSSFLIVDVSISGFTQTTCDRCMAPIRLPLHEQTRQIIVKYGEAEATEDEDEVVFVTRETPELQLAPYLYEFAMLALPMTNIYDCQAEIPQPCNREVLEILEKSSADQSQSDIWDNLRKIR